MNRNASRELRRAQARRNYLANRIAEDVAAGRQPDPRAVAAWELATMQVFARRNDLSRSADSQRSVVGASVRRRSGIPSNTKPQPQP